MRIALPAILVVLLLAAVAAMIRWRHPADRARPNAAAEPLPAADLQAGPDTTSAEIPGRGLVATARIDRAVAFNQPSNSGVSATPASPALLQDPETRALMRKQQEKALTKLADKIVSRDFARSRGLSPDQTAQVKDLVREKAVAGKDMLNAMLFDGLDDATLSQRGRETKQRLADADATLRDILGSDGFEALKAQEQSLEMRDRARHMREEFAGAEQPLTSAQQESLIEAMCAERQAFSFRVDYSDPSNFDFEHIRDVFSEANLQTYFEDLQQLDRRVAERAALFLSPAQVEQFKAAQQNQLEQARLTVKMTTELFNKRRQN